MASRTMNKKDAWILDGKKIANNVPFWSCSGKGSYWMGAAGNTIYLDFPSKSCLAGRAMKGYVFSEIAAAGATAPVRAILAATVSDQATLRRYKGYKFPAAWCDAAMTSCKAPF
jgi:hypothetical protein